MGKWSIFFLVSMFYHLDYFLGFIFQTFFEFSLVLVSKPSLNFNSILKNFNILVNRMLSSYHLHSCFIEDIYFLISLRKIIMDFFFLWTFFLCPINLLKFIFFFFWPLNFTFEAFLKCPMTSYCSEWGFQMLQSPELFQFKLFIDHTVFCPYVGGVVICLLGIG